MIAALVLHQPAAVDVLGVSAVSDRDLQGARICEVGDTEGPEGQLAFDGLIPGDPRFQAAGQFVDGFEASAADIAFGDSVLQLEEAHDEGQFAVTVDQELRRQAGVFADTRVGRAGRPHHAELPPGLVLGRRRSVGIQQVPLVEHRVGDGAGPIPRGCHRASSG